MDDATKSKLSIYLGGIKMYHDMKMIFWWLEIMKDMGIYVSRCVTY